MDHTEKKYHKETEYSIYEITEFRLDGGQLTHIEIWCPKMCECYVVYSRADCFIKLKRLDKQHEMLKIMEEFTEDMSQDAWYGSCYGIPEGKFEDLAEKVVEALTKH